MLREKRNLGGFPSTATQGVDMTTAATSMTTMRPGDLDELQDGELLTMYRRVPRRSALRDAACEVLGTSQMHVSPAAGRGTRVAALTPSRAGARVSARVRAGGIPPMKTATALTVAAIGAILAFAVTAQPSFFNFHAAGWVLMVTGSGRRVPSSPRLRLATPAPGAEHRRRAA